MSAEECVVYQPRPQYVIQVGDENAVSRMGKDGDILTINYSIGWVFESAHFNEEDARSRADLLSLRNMHVRVVERGESA